MLAWYRLHYYQLNVAQNWLNLYKFLVFRLQNYFSTTDCFPSVSLIVWLLANCCVSVSFSQKLSCQIIKCDWMFFCCVYVCIPAVSTWCTHTPMRCWAKMEMNFLFLILKKWRKFVRNSIVDFSSSSNYCWQQQFLMEIHRCQSDIMFAVQFHS